MNRLVVFLVGLGFALRVMAGAASPALGYQLRSGVEYARHGGTALTGDLYEPRRPGRYPALIAVHGGGWQAGDAKFYQYWGPFLAKHGYVLFAIDYRLADGDKNLYPAAVDDVRAAVQFIRRGGATMRVDPERLGLIGDSAGAQLATLVALTDAEPITASAPGNRASPVSTKVKICVGIYGVYDMAAQWTRDDLQHADENISQAFLGVALLGNRKIYVDASPLSHVAHSRNQTSFLLTWGTRDDAVDRWSQSDAFARALGRQGFFVRSVVVQGAAHYWAVDPLDKPGSHSAFLAPRLLDFLGERL